MAEEGAQRGRAASDRRRRESVCAKPGEVALEVVRRRACHGPAEPDGERVKVTPVRVDRAFRASRCKQREESVDVFVLDRHERGWARS